MNNNKQRSVTLSTSVNNKNQANMLQQAAMGLCLLIVVSSMITVTVSAYGPAMVEQQMQLDGGSSKSGSVSLAVIENPEITAHVLESLLRSIIVSANVDFQSISTSGSPQKRGLDLGISRGFSGSQAGKHLMGLSAASFANGPGRK